MAAEQRTLGGLNTVPASAWARPPPHSRLLEVKLEIGSINIEIFDTVVSVIKICQ